MMKTIDSDIHCKCANSLWFEFVALLCNGLAWDLRHEKEKTKQDYYTDYHKASSDKRPAPRFGVPGPPQSDRANLGHSCPVWNVWGACRAGVLGTAHGLRPFLN
eukprot:scaffold248750_cov24-Prasinocladus_malaysianus.AAC.1